MTQTAPVYEDRVAAAVRSLGAVAAGAASVGAAEANGSAASAWRALADASSQVSAASGALWQVRDCELLELLVADQRAQARREAARLAVIRELDARGSAFALERAGAARAGRGAVGTAVLLAQALNADVAACAADVRAAWALDPADGDAVTGGAGGGLGSGVAGEVRTPVAGRALAAGEISRAHAQAITYLIRALPPGTAASDRDWAEDFLVSQAATRCPREVRQLAAHIRHHLDPDGALEAERAATTGAIFWLRPNQAGLGDAGPGYRFGGTLGPIAGAQLKTFIDAHSAPDAAPTAHSAPDAAAGPSTGTAPDRSADLRSAERRRGDAFAHLVQTAVNADETTYGGLGTQLILTMDLESLRRTATSDSATPDSASDPTTSDSAADPRTPTAGEASRRPAPGMTETGAVLSAALVRQLACDAAVIPMILGGQGEPLDIGRATRAVPTGIRRALIARDRHCAFPACDRPPRWAQAHHIRHWSEGGPTALDNLVLLCPTHHDTIHHRGWTVRMRDGRPTFAPPQAKPEIALVQRAGPQHGERAPRAGP